MKKLIPVIFLCFSLHAYAQPGNYFSIGYTAARMKNSGLNYAIDRYNETRNWLTDKMEPIHFVQGYNVGLGFKLGERGLFEFQFVNRSAASQAGGPDQNGTMTYRHLKYRMNSTNMGIALKPMLNSGLTALGFSFDLGRDKISTKVGSKEQLEDRKFEKIADNLQVGTTLFASLTVNFPNKRSGFTLRPYYQIQLVKSLYADVDFYINGNTWHQSNSDKLNSKAHNFGALIFYHLNFF